MRAAARRRRCNTTKSSLVHAGKKFPCSTIRRAASAQENWPNPRRALTNACRQNRVRVANGAPDPETATIAPPPARPRETPQKQNDRATKKISFYFATFPPAKELPRKA